jgi:hypothetical protein
MKVRTVGIYGILALGCPHLSLALQHRWPSSATRAGLFVKIENLYISVLVSFLL